MGMRSLCRTRASAWHDTRWPKPPGEDEYRGQIPGLLQNMIGAAAARPGPQRWPQIASLQIRHRGNFSYVDATLTDATTLKLCRLRYVGSASQWQFAIYRASHDDYDESVFFTGLPVGTCQDALDTACGLYLNDPTAWIRPPTNLRARPLSWQARAGRRVSCRLNHVVKLRRRCGGFRSARPLGYGHGPSPTVRVERLVERRAG